MNRVYLGEIHFREIVAEDAHEAVIDPVTFELAQHILAQRGESPSKKAAGASGYHLTGKITCPTCGCRYLGTNAVGRSRTFRYYTCFTRSRYGVHHCAAPRLDADLLDAKVLDSLVDFYTNRLDEARDAIAAARAVHRQARAGHERELTVLNDQLAAKEAAVDKYLTDYEDSKIDRDTVARRVEKISEQVRQLRHRRHELIFLLDADAEEPDGTHLTQIRDRITEIINIGTVHERKAMCEALIAELRIDRAAAATPVIRVPLTNDDVPAILRTEARIAERKAVRACPPSVWCHLVPPSRSLVSVGGRRAG